MAVVPPTSPPRAPLPGLRGLAARVLDNPRVQRAVLALIVLNAAVLGLQTSPLMIGHVGEVLDLADRIIVVVFVTEILTRLFVTRGAFFRDPWNWFDVIVVGTALIPANAHFAVLRALRIVRVLRVVAVAPAMRRVVGAMLAAIPGLAATATVLVLIFYVFAVIGTHLFSDAFPAWFGHVGRSLYTLFQVMTLESWSMGISRPVMERFPYAWTFFVPFILTSTYTMLNLFIAIIVSATQSQADAEKAAAEQAREAAAEARAAAEPEPEPEPDSRAVMAELLELKRELAAVRTMLDRRD